MSELDALYAFLVAGATSALLTPLAARLAGRLGAVDQPRDRGLSDRPTPRLGGLAILAGALLAGVALPPVGRRDARDPRRRRDHRRGRGASTTSSTCAPQWKLLGQVGGGARSPCSAGVQVDNVTLPFIGPLDLRRRAGR